MRRLYFVEKEKIIWNGLLNRNQLRENRRAVVGMDAPFISHAVAIFVCLEYRGSGGCIDTNGSRMSMYN